MRWFLISFIIAYFISPTASWLTVFSKKDNDRCHYYNGKHDYVDLCCGAAGVVFGVVLRLITISMLYNYAIINLSHF